MWYLRFIMVYLYEYERSLYSLISLVWLQKCYFVMVRGYEMQCYGLVPRTRPPTIETTHAINRDTSR